MREIKFRAWDIETKSYDENHHLRLDMNGVVYNLQTGAGGEEYIVEQFTGLKDKNGKDLDWWENDILRKGSDHPNAPIGIISYNEKCAYWELVSKSGNPFCTLETAYKNGWKKIGNITEPELMEKNNVR